MSERTVAVIELEWKSARQAVFSAQEAVESLTSKGKKVGAEQQAAFKALCAKRDALKAELATARAAV
jgi:hypothetical protein